MYSQSSLTPLLATHRRWALALAALGLILAVLAAAVLATAMQRHADLVDLVVFCGFAFALLVAVAVSGHIAMRRSLIADIEQRAAILSTANRDALTGVFNRAYFLGQMKLWVRHDAHHPVGYMQIDMDNLKVLNDGNGHAAGDAALIHLVRTLEELVPGAIIGRLGGDEFGIAIVGHDNKAALRRLGDQILVALSEPVQIAGRRQRLSATIGVAVSPQDGIEVDQLISKADLALYKGKRSGRRTTIAFDGDMLADERHKRFVERELRAAILLNELELHYQPVFAADGRVASHEALVRWQHSVRGIVAPSAFVPVAEQSELIDAMGDWVLTRACRDLPSLSAPTVAVNVSAVQLKRLDFAERFEAILKATGTSGSSIVVEITETVPLKAGQIESDNLAALRRLGVRIAIDDFGAGYASLEYLRNFTFDVLKLDRSLTANVVTNRVDVLLVGAICRIARLIGVGVVAEGVETEEQREALVGLGCTHLQGFLLGRPEPLAIGTRRRSAAA
jgi:diguanylate cyclase (GGDEF)-like protein